MLSKMKSRITGYEMIKQNRFGDCQYVHNPEGRDMIRGSKWALRNPTARETARYHGVLRTYNGIQYLVSHALAKHLQPVPDLNILHHEITYDDIVRALPTTSLVVTYFNYKDCRYYLFVSDDKSYWQNVQGSIEEFDRSPIDCAIRETQEELGIRVNPEDLHEAGFFHYAGGNDVIDLSYVTKTMVYYTCIDASAIHHLTDPDTLNNKIYTVVKTKGRLNEINHVLIMPETLLFTASKKIIGKLFENHHRELALRSNHHTKYDIFYLNSFIVDFQTS